MCLKGRERVLFMICWKRVISSQYTSQTITQTCFNHFDISVNKSAKCFNSDKYQDWYVEKVLQQLNRGVAAHDVKVHMKLNIMKLLHAKWIIEMYNHPKRSKQIVISGFSLDTLLMFPNFLRSYVLYTMFMSNNLPSLHLWRKKNLVKHCKVSKYYETDFSKTFDTRITFFDWSLESQNCK